MRCRGEEYCLQQPTCHVAWRAFGMCRGIPEEREGRALREMKGRQERACGSWCWCGMWCLLVVCVLD